MKKLLMSVFIFVLVLPGLQAQRRNGLIGRRIQSMGFLTFSIGPGVCLGDAGSSRSIGTYLSNTFVDGIHNYDMALGFRHILQDGFSYKADFEYVNFSGTDKNTDLKYRGFSNISNVIELSGRGEYSYYWGRRYSRNRPHSIYGFAGVGVLNSTTKYTGTRQLYNEEHSSIFAAFIPYGIGYQYQLNTEFTIGAEIGGQYALSDFVDGFHSIRFSRSNDVLESLKFTIAYKIF